MEQSRLAIFLSTIEDLESWTLKTENVLDGFAFLTSQIYDGNLKPLKRNPKQNPNKDQKKTPKNQEN